MDLIKEIRRAIHARIPVISIKTPDPKHLISEMKQNDKFRWDFELWTSASPSLPQQLLDSIFARAQFNATKTLDEHKFDEQIFICVDLEPILTDEQLRQIKQFAASRASHLTTIILVNTVPNEVKVAAEALVKEIPSMDVFGNLRSELEYPSDTLVAAANGCTLDELENLLALGAVSKAIETCVLESKDRFYDGIYHLKG
jgi:hypothetical protein